MPAGSFFVLDLDLDLDLRTVDLDLDLDLAFLKRTWTRTWTCTLNVDLDLDLRTADLDLHLDLAVAGLVTSLLYSMQWKSINYLFSEKQQN